MPWLRSQLHFLVRRVAPLKEKDQRSMSWKRSRTVSSSESNEEIADIVVNFDDCVCLLTTGETGLQRDSCLRDAYRDGSDFTDSTCVIHRKGQGMAVGREDWFQHKYPTLMKTFSLWWRRGVKYCVVYKKEVKFQLKTTLYRWQIVLSSMNEISMDSWRDSIERFEICILWINGKIGLISESYH